MKLETLGVQVRVKFEFVNPSYKLAYKYRTLLLIKDQTLRGEVLPKY
jgi:hypothetical protein